jgi:hypothetical protein
MKKKKFFILLVEKYYENEPMNLNKRFIGIERMIIVLRLQNPTKPQNDKPI